MSRYTSSQNNFSSGRLSRNVEARTEIPQYQNGLSEMQNFIPYKSGGARLRPGFRLYNNLTASPTTTSELRIELLEVQGVKYILAIVNNGTTGSPFYMSLNNAYDNPVALSSEEIFSGTGNFTRVFSPNFEARYTFPQTTSQFTAVPPGSVSDWRIFRAQDLYILTNITGKFEPLVLYLDDAGVWKVTEYINKKLIDSPDPLNHYFAYALGYPYEKNRSTGLTFQRVGGTNAVPTVISNLNFFEATMVGTFLRVIPPQIGGGFQTDEIVFYINAFVSATEVEMTAVLNNPAVWPDGESAINTHSTSAWSAHSEYPKLINGYQQRVAFANTRDKPGTLWLTALRDSYILTVNKLIQDTTAVDNSGFGYFGDIANSDSFDMSIASNDFLEISWMASLSGLLVGTHTGEYQVKGTDETFGALNNEAVLQTRHGGANAIVQASDRSILFISKDRRELKELIYSSDAKAYIVRNLSILSQEIISESPNTVANEVPLDTDVYIRDLIWITEDNLGWVLLSNGRLIGVVKEDTFKVLSWFDIDIGPENNIIDISVYDNDLIGKNELWVTTVNSATLNPFEHNVLILPQDFRENKAEILTTTNTVTNEHPHEYRYLDYSVHDRDLVTPISTITDRFNLAAFGIPIRVMAVEVGQTDYKDLGEFDISTGTALLPGNYDYVYYGFQYTGILNSLNFEASPQQTTQAAFKRIDRVLFKMYKAVGGVTGGRSGNLYDFEYPIVASNSIDFYTGDVVFDWDSSDDYQQRIRVEVKGIAPFGVLGMFIRSDLGET